MIRRPMFAARSVVFETTRFFNVVGDVVAVDLAGLSIGTIPN